jgi:hypothetical protein
MPTTREILSSKRTAGVSSFGEVCYALDLEMMTRPSSLPKDEENWTDEMIALDAQSVAVAYKETIEAHGWTVAEFTHVHNRTPTR